ncbi:DUF1217 domain-containing protein [Roseococcus sp. SDR]|uniref:DUF1217 domain-containing protein n=1 Tax=Roseococcus sp. SDR TaxID=2835532 RepID=UPI001BD162E4|nr:DUF1217 domain-containing protein [Roseococcus sp. SDR]MBS7792628.1 DUF1217 domain-containing protein [Roseococcus sp. SDR]MBV1847942.1 DUF1217 domain-containing protein [Roseococcus sp. SDR]
MADAAAAVAAFRRVLKPGEEERALGRIATEPQQKRAMEQFKRAVDRAPDVRAALRDPRVLQVLTSALGIPEGGSQPGLATRVLLSDLNDEKSLANTLGDKRWKSAAESLNLAKGGIAALRDPQLQASLADGLRRAQWNQNLEKEQPGLGDAVLFKERATAVDGNIYAVLGDPIIRRVVTGALGLPQEIAIQSVETQARAVRARLDISKLEDPKEVQRLAERYLMNRARSESGSSAAAILARFGFPPGGFTA